MRLNGPVKTIHVATPQASEQRKKKILVRIVNPINGCGFTNLSRAERYVNRGAALLSRDASGKWSMEFRIDTKRGKDVQAAVIRSIDLGYDRASSTGCATLRQIKALPCAGDAMKVLTLRTRTTRRTQAA